MAIPDDDDQTCLLLQSYLAVYETTFNELFPHTCEALGLLPPVWQQDVIAALKDEDDFLCVYDDTHDPFPRTISFFEQIEQTLRGEVIDADTINGLNYNNHAGQFIQAGIKARGFLGRFTV